MSRITRDVGNFAIVPEALIFSTLSDRGVRLYAALARYADRTGEAYPARATLAERLHWSESGVDRAMRELVRTGLLRVTLRVKNADGEIRTGGQAKGWEPTSSLYQLVTPTADPSVTGDGTQRQSFDGTQRHPRRPIHSHLNETTGTRSSRAPDEPRGFSAWYDLYPRKVAPGKALAAYRAACKLASEEELLLGLKAQVDELRSRETRYIPHPASWLNGQRWLDEAPAPKSQKTRDQEYLEQFA